MIFRASIRGFLAILGMLLLLTLHQQSRLLMSALDNSFGTGELDPEVLLDMPMNTTMEKGGKEPDLAPKPFRKWAYAFLIGGCSTSKPEYRGFLYNAMVAAKKIRDFGSNADVVVMVQMSMHSDDAQLPEHETKVLEAMNIKVHYIPRVRAPEHEIFYSLVQEKFRILSLTEYSRVLFLDGDIMPACNMDYLFDLSEPENGEPTLKENIVLSWRKEAANAGFFMLSPSDADYQTLTDIIRTKEERALELPWPHWDEVEGWGHVIKAPDYWRTEDGLTGTNWTWHAVFADQGLLYHWTKYVKKSVSLIISKEVENWGDVHGELVLEETLMRDPLSRLSCLEQDRKTLSRKPSPYRDFVHFTGRAKPWEPMNYLAYLNITSPELVSKRKVNKRLSVSALGWYEALEEIGRYANTTFDFQFAMDKGGNKPPVGRFSDYGQMIKHIKLKAYNNWTHYETE